MGNEKKPARMFENILFVKIFRTFRIAIHPGKLMIAFSAVVIIYLAGLVMDINKTVIATPDIDNQQTTMYQGDQIMTFQRVVMFYDNEPT